MNLSGRVIQEQKNYYVVNTERGDFRTQIKGILKKDRKRICTGDLVEIEIIDDRTAEALITKIHERSTFLNRPPLANLDQVFIVCTFREPPLDLEALDRLLLCAGAYSLSSVIIFNKSDLVGPRDQSEWHEVIESYRCIGYPVLESSVIDGTGIEDIIMHGRGKISAFTGLSGVGKSAILSRLFPDCAFVIGEVSGTTGRGTHTTTTVSLLALPGEGYIADTPGLTFIDLPLVPEDDVVSYFPELGKEIGHCRFNNCIHEHEPGCRVRELVESGTIKKWRMENYLKIHHEMRERRRKYKEKTTR